MRPPRIAPAYVGSVAATAAVLSRLDPSARQAVVLACSTNVRNLQAGRWSTLVSSLFVLDGPADPRALAALLVVLGLAEVVLGPAGLLLVVAAGHVGASLAVHAVLRSGTGRRWWGTAGQDGPDVGTSYAALAATGALVAVLPRGHRALAGRALAAAVVVPVLRGRGPTDLGHLLAALLGAAAGAALRG